MSRNLLSKAVMIALISLGGGASAQSIADQVVPQLQAQGYTRIEVKNGISQIKVEAIRGNQEFEVVYDARTGRVLKQEMNRVDAGDDTRPGVRVRNEGRDFVRAGGGRSNDDGRRDRADDDDDDDDDDRGRGRGGRDRADDDDDDDDRGRGRGRGGRDRADDDDDDDDRGRGRGKRDRSDKDDDDDDRGRGRGRDRDDDDDDDDDDD